MATATEIDPGTQVSTRIPPRLHEQIQKLADANDRSVAAEVRVALRQYVDRYSTEAAA